MAGYKFTYFNATGRGEVTRLLFAIAGVEYEDIRIEFKDFPAIKNDTPFGGIPMLEWGKNKRLCQSHTIEAYLAKKLGLAGHTAYEEARASMVANCAEDILIKLSSMTTRNAAEDVKAVQTKKFVDEDLPVYLDNLSRILCENGGGDGYFVGDQLTYADLVVFVLIIMIGKFLKKTIPWKKYPKLDALGDRVTDDSRVRAWLKNRPVTYL